MTNVKLLLAGLYAASAFASPWSRYLKRGEDGWTGEHHGVDSWGKGHHGGHPYGGCGNSESAGPTRPWGYGSTSSCEAETSILTLPGSVVTNSQPASTVTLEASTVYVSQHASTV